jgi:hypothetical protein
VVKHGAVVHLMRKGEADYEQKLDVRELRLLADVRKQPCPFGEMAALETGE